MNNRSLFRMLAMVALVFAVAAVVGIGAYNAGVAQGIAESGRLAAAAPAGAPVVYYWPRPWFFFPFFPFLFIFLLFALVRGIFWRAGLWRGGWGHYGQGGVPPAFEEWHRRAHAEQPRT